MEYKRFENETVDECTYRICSEKDKIGTWQDVANILNKLLDQEFTESAYRKKYQAFQRILDANREKFVDDNSQLEEIKLQIENLRKERIKLQTANIERNRVDRSESRQEMYYEYVGSICNALEVPEFEEIHNRKTRKQYLLTLADLHYGAEFESLNNFYSKSECVYRFERLLDYTKSFIKEKELAEISIVMLGDVLQGILRVSDLKLNDSSVVKSTVEVSRLIAQFLNDLSKYIKITYYHTPSANHTQLRPLATKASELADEDLEYLIGNYIKDLLRNNERIDVVLADENKQFVNVSIFDYNVLAMHGHQIKNIDSAIKDLTMLNHEFVDYLILGHYHGGKEITSQEGICSDAEILISPSFIGSDPYSDTLMKGAKSAVKIYGFDELYGHTETYKFVLN